MNQVKKKWWMFLVLAFLIIQFMRVDKAVPKTHPDEDFLVMMSAPDSISTLVKNACYDCHSYETEYPWYAEVAPLSWWIKGHIDHGRDNLNFSLWNSYPEDRQQRKLDECVEEIKEETMPLKSFTVMHSEAKLNSDQRRMLAEWFQSQKK